MKTVIQRVLKCSVSVDGNIISSIGPGLFVLVGISVNDTDEDLEYISRKILNLRLFEDVGRRWSKSVVDKDYEVLCVSQFTLCHKIKGNKLDFHEAMKAEDSFNYYSKLLKTLRTKYKEEKVKDGKFGAHMLIDLCNDGPVTIELESNKRQDKEQKGEENVLNETKTVC